MPTETGAIILVTGFGPFPGIERNASADLIAPLIRRARSAFPDHTFHSAVLPVDWEEAPKRLSALIKTAQPHIALHFGVSHRASGIVVETLAYNEAREASDVAGRQGPGAEICPGDRPTRTSTLPVRAILKMLHRQGLPATASADPGRYLCNAVMYHSLRQARLTTPHMRSGFIHLPATIMPGEAGVPSDMAFEQAVAGAMLIIEASLGPLQSRPRFLS